MPHGVTGNTTDSGSVIQGSNPCEAAITNRWYNGIMVWRLYGTENQQRLVREALAACDFPFDALVPGLKSQVGRDYIPVEWADLSRYTAQFKEAKAAGGHNHVHDDEWGVGHPIEREVDGRRQVLGLAWYSGKVTLDYTLERYPDLAKEVFLAEGAHMVDFFYMTDDQRVAVWNAFHLDHEDLSFGTDVEDGVDLGHGHGWFDVGGYYSWVGEAFMGGFIKAYAPSIPVTIEFDHPATDEAGREIRKALTPQLVPDGPVVDTDATPYFVGKNRSIYHDSHKNIAPVEYFATPPPDARACKVCKPK